MEFLILLVVVGGVYFWLKYRSDKTKTVKDREIFPSRGVPLVKRVDSVASDKQAANAENLKVPDAELEQIQPAIVKNPADQTETSKHTQEASVQINSQAFSTGGEKSVNQVPEDSVLRRHFFAKQDSEKQAITHPYPTDSVLRRHYQSMLAASLGSVAFAATAAVDVSTIQNPSEAKQQMPEDSVLKRHFIAQLMADIENSADPRPTDSVLKRHYAHLIQAKLSDRLVEMTD